MRIFSWLTPAAAEIVAPPLAALLWYLSPRKRRVTRINLRAAFPAMDAGERNRVARASMTHYVRGVLEAGMLWHWPLDRIYKCIDEGQGMDLYLEAARSESGMIFVGLHCGAWELLGLYIQQHLKGATLYKSGRFKGIDEMLVEKRQRGGSQLVPASGAGLRTIFKLLKTGHAITMVPDQEPSLGEGQFAPFYGIETLTAVLLPRMARRTRVPVIFGVCERCKGGRYRVNFFKADESIYDADMRTAVTAVNHGFEQCIDVAVEQYLWAYKRFRSQPGGDRSFYKR
jgi:KDO2-lipid IV(A) lauroyltransferase